MTARAETPFGAAFLSSGPIGGAIADVEPALQATVNRAEGMWCSWKNHLYLRPYLAPRWLREPREPVPTLRREKREWGDEWYDFFLSLRDDQIDRFREGKFIHVDSLPADQRYVLGTIVGFEAYGGMPLTAGALAGGSLCVENWPLPAAKVYRQKDRPASFKTLINDEYSGWKALQRFTSPGEREGAVWSLLSGKDAKIHVRDAGIQNLSQLAALITDAFVRCKLDCPPINVTTAISARSMLVGAGLWSISDLLTIAQICTLTSVRLRDNRLVFVEAPLATTLRTQMSRVVQAELIWRAMSGHFRKLAPPVEAVEGCPGLLDVFPEDSLLAAVLTSYRSLAPRQLVWFKLHPYDILEIATFSGDQLRATETEIAILPMLKVRIRSRKGVETAISGFEPKAPYLWLALRTLAAQERSDIDSLTPPVTQPQ